MVCNKEDLPLTLTVPQVGEILGIGRVKAYELAKRKDFPSFTIGKRILISRESFFQWLEQQAAIK